VDLSSFSHQELITFLRQCPETNSLTLYRDASRSQTPLTPDNLKLEPALSIEEVDCSSASGSLSGHCSPDIQEALSAPSSPAKELSSPIFNSNQSTSLPRGTSQTFLMNSEFGDKPERPNELNFNDQNRKQGYIFNCNWNFNKNKY